MNEVTKFENIQFGGLTVVLKDDEEWFIGNAIAEMLGYSIPKDAISTLVDTEDKVIFKRGDLPPLDFTVPNRGLTFINESGLYSLILRSKLPEAKAFKRWITKEVLPSIRKNGAYIQGQDEMDDLELMAKAVLSAQNIIEGKNKKIEQQHTLIQSKNHPVSLSKMFFRNSKIVQAANLWLEDKGYIEKYFKDNEKKGWTLTESGKVLGFGSQVNPAQIFWTSDILKELPSTKELLEFAERLDLCNFTTLNK